MKGFSWVIKTKKNSSLWGKSLSKPCEKYKDCKSYTFYLKGNKSSKWIGNFLVEVYQDSGVRVDYYKSNYLSLSFKKICKEF